MKFNVFVGLLVAATCCVFASIADAQDVAAAPSGGEISSKECAECDECVGGFGAIRGRVGAGVGVVRGRVGAGFGAVRGGFGADGSFRSRLQDRLYVRDVVEASPFATPSGEPQDWARFKYYPYGYYPHNFNAGAPSMRLPQYNPAWQNYYPAPRRFHEGKHFVLDVF